MIVEARVNCSGPFAGFADGGAGAAAENVSIQLALEPGGDDGTRSDAVLDLSAGPQSKFKNGLEVAGPGPEVTASYKAKVQKALEFFDAAIARWWKSNSVEGQVRARAASFWQFSYYGRTEGDRPVIYVDEDFTAGQTAEAILAEAASGWFATSIGAAYKKYRVAQTLDSEEFQKWKRGAGKEAARYASILAEMYVTSIASIGPAGELVVTIAEVSDRGPHWDQLVSVLPVMGFLSATIVVKVAGRRVEIPKQVARELKYLTPSQRKRLLAQAAAAKTDEQAAAIIERAVAAAKGSRHHLATNKNWISTLRGGPWSPRFHRIFAKAGMSLEDAENIVRIPGHYGPHAQQYHRVIHHRLTTATEGKHGAAYKAALIHELERMADEATTVGTRLNNLLFE